jgi:hypothetical protein
LFDALYRYLLLMMGELFAEAADQASLMGRLYRLMTGGLSFLARYLMEHPLGEGLWLVRASRTTTSAERIRPRIS